MSDVKDRSDEADNPRSVRETIINFVGGEGNKLVATAYDSGEPAIGKVKQVLIKTLLFE